ncbi:MAG: histidine--tRNA ligase [Methanomassiliicoccales archaeon]|nr:MAG: histidine--tRNA ligase [Methanomassiliicoccales archaeon]
MPIIQRPRGTRDFGPEEMGKRRYIEGVLRTTAETFGYREIATPTFEHAELYTERSGEAIKNEMYMFKDKGGRELSLRPELTMPTIRFYAEELRNKSKPIKVYYFGNCFRYERPQSGRFREFWQYGAEVIGGGEHESDADIIALAVNSLENAGLKKFVTRIGHLGVLRALLWEIGIEGEKQSKCMQLIDKKDTEELFTILNAHSPSNLGIDRIRELLELKESKTVLKEARKIVAGNRKALKAIESLDKILTTLGLLGIENFIIDLGIARGLDYYTGMVFEIDVPTLGAEKQVCGGGAYELAELFGAESTNSTGFAIGFDRVVMALERQKAEIPTNRITAYVIPLDGKARNEAMKIATALRKSGISCSTALLERNLSKHMKHANAICAEYVIILGEDEIAEKKASVKNMETGEQVKVDFEKLLNHFNSTEKD